MPELSPPTRLLLPLVACLSLSGCFNLPELRRLVPDLPSHFPEQSTPATAKSTGEAVKPESKPAATTPRPLPPWWQAYQDPTLDALMEEALAHNSDLAQAIARMDEARANLGLARGAQYPYVSASLDASRSRRSQRTATPVPGSAVNNNYGLGLAASYELDLWGRLSRATEAARADLLASEYGKEVVRLALSDQLARSYFELLALDARLALSRETAENQRLRIGLLEKRLSAGLGSDLEIIQAQAELATVEADQAQLDRQVHAQENALGLLLGRSPRQLQEDQVKRAAGRLQALPLPPPVAAGLPSELLLHRPDLRQAEAQLAAADARIAELRAAVFPSISLTAGLGTESSSLSNLFSSPATTWNLGASLLQTVFNASRTERAIEAAAARREQQLIAYESGIRQAFGEVLDALVAHRQARERREAEERRVEALSRAYHLAQRRQEVGSIGYLEVLDAQRQLYQAQASRIDALREQLAVVSLLYKALGGGPNGSAATP